MLKVTNDVTEFVTGDVIYFSAGWCQPCKQLKPEYARASVRDSDHNYYLFDVDEVSQNSEGVTLMQRLSVQSIPALFVVTDIGFEKITARKADKIVDEVSRLRQ